MEISNNNINQLPVGTMLTLKGNELNSIARMTDSKPKEGMRKDGDPHRAMARFRVMGKVVTLDPTMYADEIAALEDKRRATKVASASFITTSMQRPKYEEGELVEGEFNETVELQFDHISYYDVAIAVATNAGKLAAEEAKYAPKESPKQSEERIRQLMGESLTQLLPGLLGNYLANAQAAAKPAAPAVTPAAAPGLDEGLED